MQTTITITGQTPAQKNSKSIAKNRATGKMFIMSNSNVKNWQKGALYELAGVKERFPGRVRVDYMFYVKDNRARDLDNMIASVNDLLQAANASSVGEKSVTHKTGIITGDHWQVLEIGSAKAEIDRERPRAEITITEID